MSAVYPKNEYCRDCSPANVLRLPPAAKSRLKPRFRKTYKPGVNLYSDSPTQTPNSLGRVSHGSSQSLRWYSAGGKRCAQRAEEEFSLHRLSPRASASMFKPAGFFSRFPALLSGITSNLSWDTAGHLSSRLPLRLGQRNEGDQCHV